MALKSLIKSSGEGVIIITMSLSSQCLYNEVDKWVPTSGDGKLPHTAVWLGILSYDDDDDDDEDRPALWGGI